MYHIRYNALNDDRPILNVIFFQLSSGREPVREWLLDLSKEDRKAIGADIKLIQFRWPLGMPLVRKMEPDLWEVRTRLDPGRIARVFFSIHGNEMALLHGYVKKSQKTPLDDLRLARIRKDMWQSEQRYS
jgi:phage-related protein